MSIAIKIRMQPHIILNESISCRRSAENKTPKTDSNDRKSDAIAEFTYFISVVNKSMTGEDLFIDNGEKLKSNFIW